MWPCRRPGGLGWIWSGPKAGAAPDQIVQVHEYLDPPVDEIAGTLPTALGRRLADSPLFRSAVDRIAGRGLVVTTTSVHGFTMLTTVARLQPLRPRSLRFGREQQAIEDWMELALRAAESDQALAGEILRCQQVLKGYGATHAHGSASFARLMVAARGLIGEPEAAATLSGLRVAALQDEDGRALQAALARQAVLSPA